MMKQYFVAEPGSSPHGPYAEAMVKRAFEHGMYPAGTKVWWEGGMNWTPIELVFGNGVKHPSSPPSATSRPTPSSGWNIINAFTSNMKRYVHFKGRSSKAEYWYFILAQIIISAVSLCLGEEGYTVVLILMSMGFFLPNMAISFRRLQDAGYNGTTAAVISGVLAWIAMLTIMADEFLVTDFLELLFIIVLGCMPAKNVNNPYGSAPLPPI